MAFAGKIGSILKQAAKSNQSVHQAARLSEVIGQSTLYHGKIAQGKVITDRAAGMSKGFGFVTSATNGEISAKLDRESSTSYISRMIKGKMKAEGTSSLSREHLGWYMAIRNPTKQLNNPNVKHWFTPYLVRTSASYSTQASTGAEKEKMRNDISTTEDPFNAPTYNIPEKPVTFTEGASYTVVILAGLGVAIFAAYAVLKELIFEPKEYKIFGKALERVQKDSRVTVRIGSPVTGYGQESRNRAARQRISSRVWKDEEGVEHVQVNFFIRGPNGAGKVSSEMFKDQADKTWKFTYLIVEITSPSRVQLMLESYIPA